MPDSVLGTEEATAVPVDRLRASLMAVALTVAGPAILMLVEPGHVHRLVGWVATAYAPIAWLELRDRRPLLVLEAAGFRGPRRGLGLIAWADVSRARLWGFGESVYLCLRVDHLDDYLLDIGAWRSLVLWLTLARGHDQLRVNLTLSGIAPREVLREVSRRCEALSGRRA